MIWRGFYFHETKFLAKISEFTVFKVNMPAQLLLCFCIFCATGVPVTDLNLSLVVYQLSDNLALKFENCLHMKWNGKTTRLYEMYIDCQGLVTTTGSHYHRQCRDQGLFAKSSHSDRQNLRRKSRQQHRSRGWNF